MGPRELLRVPASLLCSARVADAIEATLAFWTRVHATLQLFVVPFEDPSLALSRSNSALKCV